MRRSPFRSNFLTAYVACAPLALAFERSLECRILSEQTFERPILDLGCGDGLFARILFADPIDTGIDPSEQELRKAARARIYQELIRCPGSAIPKPDGAYKTVFSNSVLEHIPDLLPVLAEVHRILAPGGSFYFTVPADNFEVWSAINQFLLALGLKSQSRKYRHFFNRFWKHHHAYPESRWKELAEQARFEVANIFRYDPPRVALGNDMAVFFALPSMLLNKFFGRWVLWPKLRRIVLRPFFALFDSWLNPLKHAEGCLVFVQAVKPSGTAR
ncbi:MAG TPA: class I SAM-dependent methyltransferase [Chthoniobacterales bacterium]